MNDNSSPIFLAKKSEKGQAIVMIAILLIVILGFTALAIDGGRIYSERRTAQNAADAAAMSAALTKCSKGNITAAAQQIAASNGFNNDGINNIITVNSPPNSGPYANDAKYVEVIIETRILPGFASVIHPEPFSFNGRAVSHCTISSSTGGAASGTPYANAIVVLDKTECKAMKITGNGNVTVVSGGVFVNSSCAGADPALVLSGNGNLNAKPIAVVGGTASKGNGKLSQAATHPTAITAFWTIPTPPKPAGTCQTVDKNATVIDPGLYCGITPKKDLTMNPGIYWIESGGFDMSSNANVTADKVMIYFGPNGGGLKITGNGNLYLTAPISGDYKGMALFADVANGSLMDMSGNGNLTLTGTTYASAGIVKITGNGTNLTLTAQIISDQLELAGNGNLTIRYDATKFYIPPANSASISLDE